MQRKDLFILCLILIIAGACHQSHDSEKVADQHNDKKADHDTSLKPIKTDSKFVVRAYSGVTMETELGTYAAKNAVTPGVRNFGRTMVTDHSKDKEALSKIASAKGIVVPPQTGADFQKHINEITSKKGLDFDKAYISFMVNDHKEDISEFEEEAKDGKDPEIKSFAAKGVPILQHHLEMAVSLNAKLK